MKTLFIIGIFIVMATNAYSEDNITGYYLKGNSSVDLLKVGNNSVKFAFTAVGEKGAICDFQGEGQLSGAVVKAVLKTPTDNSTCSVTISVDSPKVTVSLSEACQIIALCSPKNGLFIESGIYIKE